MNPAKLIQGTQEWKSARAGIITASRIADILAKPTKGAKESTSRRNYRAELVCERLTGNPTTDSYQSFDMKRGTELEPDARAEYELKRDATIITAGLLIHPKYKFTGGSPDGLIGKEGMVQIKCPKPAIHLDWLRSGRVPAEHIPQMQWEMACAVRKWNDFVSYCPNFPDALSLFVVRLDRDEPYIASVEEEVLRFNAEVDEAIASLPQHGTDDADPLLITAEDAAHLLAK